MRLRVQGLLVLILCLGGLGWLGSWSVYSQRRTSPAWEYKFIEFERGGRAQKEINALAGQGWELITVQGVLNSDSYVYYLKRAK